MSNERASIQKYDVPYFKEMLQVFVKNTKLDLYEDFSDFWKDHLALEIIEKELSKIIVDDDEATCKNFNHLIDLHKKVMKNVKITNVDGDEKLFLDMEIKFKEVTTKEDGESKLLKLLKSVPGL